MNNGADAAHALAPQFHHVAHLVHEDQKDETDGKSPSKK